MAPQNHLTLDTHHVIRTKVSERIKTHNRIDKVVAARALEAGDIEVGLFVGVDRRRYRRRSEYP